MDISRRVLNRRKKPIGIHKQLNKLLCIVIFPFLILVVILLYMLSEFNNEYTDALQNANNAAEFNNNFKKDMEREMWYHAIRPRGVEADKTIPWIYIEDAQDVLLKLKKTTTQRDNRWRINSMLNMLENLSTYMDDIANTKSYDERMEKLDGDFLLVIQLIETYMHDYIYDEINQLTILQKHIVRKVRTAIVVTFAVSAILLSTILAYSLRFTKRITQPISQLCDKVNKIGSGDFLVEPIKTTSKEIMSLDDGFNEMVDHINALMEKQIKNQDALHKAELELLQAQINPHFLYNTLDSIVWLAETHRDTEVIKMVTSLSVFFRNSLSNGKDIITLEAEKDQVKSYLEIQKIRYSDILDYTINIPENLFSYFVPKLTLQPLVENAIYHGIKHKRRLGKINIYAYERDNDVVIVIKDNGAGMTKDQLSSLRSNIYEDGHTGLGLINVHKRLKLYCGKEYGLHFYSTEGEGTTVNVNIPKEI